MIIQPSLLSGSLASRYASNPSLTAPVGPSKVADTVTISEAAQKIFSSWGDATSPSAVGTNAIDAKLAQIKSRDAMSRSQEDWDYLFANDKRLAEIDERRIKDPRTITAADEDYEQKARGLVNTMAYLSPAEKALYDKAIASGNTDAAAGLAQIALIRTGGHLAGGANGTTYDPMNTAITAENIRKYFSYSIVDPSGKAQSQFQALISFLEGNAANT